MGRRAGARTGVIARSRGPRSYDRWMADSAGGHVAVTRRLWDEHMSAWFERYARSRWAQLQPYWGMVVHSPSRGCQSCRPTWLTWRRWSWAAAVGTCQHGWPAAARRPVGVDVSARRLWPLRTACRASSACAFRWFRQDAERVPLGCRLR